MNDLLKPYIPPMFQMIAANEHQYLKVFGWHRFFTIGFHMVFILRETNKTELVQC